MYNGYTYDLKFSMTLLPLNVSSQSLAKMIITCDDTGSQSGNFTAIYLDVTLPYQDIYLDAPVPNQSSLGKTQSLYYQFKIT